MPKLNPRLFLDDEYETYAGRRKQQILQTNQKHSRRAERVAAGIANQLDRMENIHFTYNASRHERLWLVNSLGNFYELHWFSDVLRLIKGGKEGSGDECRADPCFTANYIAAKIYRPRKFRNLKNDHLYREGRYDLGADGLVILDDGMQHAMRKRTAYGLELLHTSWIEHEVKTLNLLHSAGADVPKA